MTSELQIDFTDNLGECLSELVATSLVSFSSRAAFFKGIPKENIPIRKPVFLGACTKDFIGLAAKQKATTASLAKHLTVHEYDVGHWVQLEAKDEVNRDLLAWFEAL